MKRNNIMLLLILLMMAVVWGMVYWLFFADQVGMG